MAFNTTWDVDKYKSEYESEEHWELRKNFILAHRDKFPEDKLVCLARVFFNVEFLGCRYPDKTMKLIADLSKGVADEHREKQKGKLKRTFVQASDAAGAKIKGTPSSAEPPNKVPKIGDDRPDATRSHYSCFVHASLVKPQTPVPAGDFPGFIIFENMDVKGQQETCPINILTHSCAKSKQWNTIKFTFTSKLHCEITINNKLLSSASGATSKEAKFKAALEGLNKLREYCYTIQAKVAFFSDDPSIRKEGAMEKEPDKPLPQDNIGSRMMQKMGWTGSGLGKQQQGIQTPVQATQVLRRAGFGNIHGKEFHNKFRNIFKDYIAKDSAADLVFAPDFSSDERKVLHKSDLEESEEDNLEDFFGSDNSSDGSDEVKSEAKTDEWSSSCPVCCKLSNLTGEESDDEIYDVMWDTGSDTTGLVLADRLDGQSPRGERAAWECGTDDEVCDMDLSDDPKDKTDIESQSTDIKMKNSTNKSTELIDGGTKDDVPIVIRYRRPRNRSSDVKLQYYLPDGSFLRVPMDCVRRHTILTRYTFPKGDTCSFIPGLYIKVSEKDLETVPGLWQSLLDKATRRKFPGGELLRNSDSHFQDYPHSTNKSQEEENIARCDLDVLVKNDSSSKSCKIVQSDINEPSENMSGQTYAPLNSIKTHEIEENVNEKVKIFLPDGSYKRIPLLDVKASKGLREITKYYPGKAASELNCKVTARDLKSNTALRELFADFLTLSQLPNNTESRPKTPEGVEPEMVAPISLLNAIVTDSSTFNNKVSITTHCATRKESLIGQTNEQNAFDECSDLKITELPSNLKLDCKDIRRVGETELVDISKNSTEDKSLKTQDGQENQFNNNLLHVPCSFKQNENDVEEHGFPTRKFKFDRLKIQYFMPDGSIFRIFGKFVRLSKILYDYTFPDGDKKIRAYRVDVTKNDLDRIPELWSAILKYAVRRKMPDGTVYKYGAKSYFSPLDLTKQNDITNVLEPRLLEEVGIIQEPKNNSVPQNENEKEQELKLEKDSKNRKMEEKRNEQIKIFLSDGSFKVFSLKLLETNEELKKITKYSPDKPVSELVNRVSDEDLKTNEALRKLFLDSQKSSLLSSNILVHHTTMNEHSKSTSSHVANPQLMDIRDSKNVHSEIHSLSSKPNQEYCGDRNVVSKTYGNVIKNSKSLCLDVMSENTSMSTPKNNDNTETSTSYGSNKFSAVSEDQDQFDLGTPPSVSLNISQLPIRQLSNYDKNKKLTVTLPNGSKWHVPFPDIKNNVNLSQFFSEMKCNPDSPAVSITDKDLSTNTGLAAYFKWPPQDLQSLRNGNLKVWRSGQLTNPTISPNVQELVDSSVNHNPPTHQRLFKRGRRMPVRLKDGTRARVNFNYIKNNKYFIHYTKKQEMIKAGIAPEDIPNLDCSDTSSDEERWVPKIAGFQSSGDSNQLRSQWNNFLISFGSSKSNPMAKKWRDFVDRPSSGHSQEKTLSQLWKKFLASQVDTSQKTPGSPQAIDSNKGKKSVPDVSNKRNCSHSGDVEKSEFNGSENYLNTNQDCVEDILSKPFADLENKPLTSYSQVKNCIPELFDLNTDSRESSVSEINSLEKHLLGPGPSSANSSLESHVNSLEVTTIHSSNALPLISESSNVPDESSVFVKVKKPDSHKSSIVVYLPDGSKMKIKRKHIPISANIDG